MTDLYFANYYYGGKTKKMINISKRIGTIILILSFIFIFGYVFFKAFTDTSYSDWYNGMVDECTPFIHSKTADVPIDCLTFFNRHGIPDIKLNRFGI